MSDQHERRKDPGPTGAEFRESQHRAAKVRLILSVVVVGLLLLNAGFSVYNAVTDVDHDDAIVGCQASRTALSAVYQREIDDALDPAQTRLTLKFIPTITREQLEEFKAEEVAELKRYQATVDPDQCEELFE